jgi:5,5'-dehydrodivanillate O-demethylase oxygenase subunit
MPNSRPPHPVTVDDIVHTGPGTLGGRYMRRFWHPVYRARDLLQGHAKPIRVLSEDFTLYRGASGTPHVVAPRCAHRGTQLSTGWVESDCLRCFYHGWKYDHTGQCVKMPAEETSFPPKVHIKSYPTAEYLGLIFAYLGEGAPPPLPRYPELEDEGVLEVNTPVVWPCNYFNRIENSGDEVHLAFVHRDSDFTTNGLVDVPEVWAEETEFGFTKYGKRRDGSVRVSHFHMPNTNFIKGSPNEPDSGWVEHLSWRVPVDDETCASYTMQLTHVTGEAAARYRERRRQRLERAAGAPSAAEYGARVLRGELRIADIEERLNVVNVQDYVAQVGQGAIANRHDERLGRSDAVLILMRKLWLRELQALADEQPLKDWRRTERVAVTIGTA